MSTLVSMCTPAFFTSGATVHDSQQSARQASSGGYAPSDSSLSSSHTKFQQIYLWLLKLSR